MTTEVQDELEDEAEHEDSGVFEAILDLRMGPVHDLECDWISVGPNAHNVEHAKVNLAACRAAIEKLSDALNAQGKRDAPITVEAQES